MAKWPNVPAVYGWLALTQRGVWRLDGSLVHNRTTIEFINRNYGADAAGAWYFQNGPQRVYIDLDYVPWVVTLDGYRDLITHTGEKVSSVDGVWLDGDSNLLVHTEYGIALVCDRDLDTLLDQFCRMDGLPLDLVSLEAELENVSNGAAGSLHFRWPNPLLVEFIDRARVGPRFGFEPRPRAAV